MIADPNRPADPRLAASLILCRRRWLSLPLAERRRHWDLASKQLGMLSGVAGWVELRAWELAGIRRWQARVLTADPYVAADLVRRYEHLLSADPLGQGPQEAAGGAIGDEDDDPGVPAARAAQKGFEAA